MGCDGPPGIHMLVAFLSLAEESTRIWTWRPVGKQALGLTGEYGCTVTPNTYTFTSFNLKNAENMIGLTVLLARERTVWNGK